MPHQTPNPHDVEEQLRPYLAELFESQNAPAQLGQSRMRSIDRTLIAYDRALGKALQLLGVQR
jgi:hypothetical protein